MLGKTWPWAIITSDKSLFNLRHYGWPIASGGESYGSSCCHEQRYRRVIENFSRQVFHEGGQENCSNGSHTYSTPSFTEYTINMEFEQRSANFVQCLEVRSNQMTVWLYVMTVCNVKLKPTKPFSVTCNDMWFCVRINQFGFSIQYQITKWNTPRKKLVLLGSYESRLSQLIQRKPTNNCSIYLQMRLFY